ncbi:MAG: protein translocase subunit SecD [Gaiellales bacterium]
MRRYHLIIVLVVALLGAAVALALTRSPVLGLDLQGGVEIVLEAQAPAGEEITKDALDRSVSIIRNRVDRIGVSEPEIRTQGEDQIVIELAGVDDPERAAQIVGKTAELQFYDLEGDALPPSIDSTGTQVLPSPKLYPLLQDLQAQLKSSGEPAAAWYLYGKDKRLLAGPEVTKEEILEDLPDGKAPEGSEFLGVPAGMTILTCGPPESIYCPGVSGVPIQPFYYVFRYQPTDPENPVPELTGRDLELKGTRADFDQTGQSIVLLQFTGEGQDKFHAITKALAERGVLKTQQYSTGTDLFQHFAIVLDGKIITAPYIDFNQNPDGIAGNAQITGLESDQAAQDLALVLQTGALPLKFEQVNRTVVSATLGEDSLREAVIAAIGGLVAVALFLLLIYRFLGLVAIAGLAVYGVFLYGAILLFNVTLTLPGFAGLILTIGVAADANIVIFERIKEEVRSGKSVRAAITTGYRKGFATIVDANVVTMITAFILFAVATAGVKGFALMLLIGTALSMFTAVAATRAMLGVISGFRWFDNPKFMGASPNPVPAWQKIDFMGKRRTWFAISAAVVLIGIVALGVRGLNLGIDFEGGTQVGFTTPAPTSVEEVRSVAGEVVGESAVVQGRGTPEGDDLFTQFQIRTESLTAEQGAELNRALVEGVQAESIGSSTVTGSFSGQILRSAILAICVSLVLIFLYVWLRFGWRFGVPVMVALLHDLVITLGVYALVQAEVSTSTVAAVLTILGYSIYDTIIIFDRIRENIPLMRHSSFAAVANQSLWETIRRSLATSFITVLPVLSLLLFGGDTLKDFALALLVGIISGAYSTIFIATPLLAVIMEREPEWANRRGTAAEDVYDKQGERAEGAAVPPAVSSRRLSRRMAGAVAGAGHGAATPTGDEEPPGAEPDVDEAPVEADAEVPAPVSPADQAARREARRQRRRTRPHGRAR